MFFCHCTALFYVTVSINLLFLNVIKEMQPRWSNRAEPHKWIQHCGYTPKIVRSGVCGMRCVDIRPSYATRIRPQLNYKVEFFSDELSFDVQFELAVVQLEMFHGPISHMAAL